MGKMSVGNFLSVAEAAELIGCSDGRVRQMLRAKELRGQKLHHMAWVVEKRDAERMAKKTYTTGRPRTRAS